MNYDRNTRPMHQYNNAGYVPDVRPTGPSRQFTSDRSSVVSGSKSYRPPPRYDGYQGQSVYSNSQVSSNAYNQSKSRHINPLAYQVPQQPYQVPRQPYQVPQQPTQNEYADLDPKTFNQSSFVAPPMHEQRIAQPPLNYGHPSQQAPRKKTPLVPIILVLVCLLAIAGACVGVYFYLQSNDSADAGSPMTVAGSMRFPEELYDSNYNDPTSAEYKAKEEDFCAQMNMVTGAHGTNELCSVTSIREGSVLIFWEITIIITGTGTEAGTTAGLISSIELAVQNNEINGTPVFVGATELEILDGNADGTSTTTTTPTTTSTTVVDNECEGYMCSDDQTCIPSSSVCDDIDDCPLADDEQSCDALVCSEFMCDDNSGCYDYSEYCNGYQDCQDGSDETLCEPEECVEGEEFQCSETKRCIPVSWLCDREADCFNHGDEHNCSCSEPHYHQCDNGECIPSSWFCDEQFDCFDESDEPIACVPICPVGQVYCDDIGCFPDSWVCDGEADCNDGSDEPSDCVYSCGSDEFQCESGKCIPQSWLCDGTSDCIDHSDEPVTCDLDCDSLSLATCSDGQCVPEAFLCDSEYDCRDFSDESSCECPETDFSCDVGNLCIPSQWRCDGENDCNDGSDELNCQTVCQDLGLIFCNNSGQCINGFKVCNNINDCDDGEDELGCECSDDQFTCSNSMCISLNWYCDGENDCADGSDEPIDCATVCNPDYQWQCDGICIRKLWRCDGEIDCVDKSDEYQCDCPAYDLVPCESGNFCTQPSYWCDGEADCPDASDEPDSCSLNSCNAQSFQCATDEAFKTCISLNQKCDFIDDCGDNSDELDCPCHQDYQFTCGDGECVANDFVCDGSNDCQDGSDENDCGDCGDNQWSCFNHDCILYDLRCNGQVDCLDQSDEHGCAFLVDNVLRVVIASTTTGQYNDVFVCGDQWDDIINDDVCSQMGLGPHESRSVISPAAVNAGDSSNVVQIISTSFDFFQEAIMHIDSSSCSSGYVTLMCGLPECGTRPLYDESPAAHIVGGSYAEQGQFPWQVSLQQTGRHVCGAAIINENWIVTAAHCFDDNTDPAEFSIKTGSLKISPGDHLGLIERDISEIIVHENYDTKFLLNDIALIKVDVPLEFTDRALPVCLPVQGEVPSPRPECFVSGWGGLSESVSDSPVSLRWIKWNLISDERCTSLLSVDFYQESMICAQTESDIYNTCYGDSGGPLVCRDHTNRFHLVGLVSWSYGCHSPPDVYTRVPNFVEWIENVLMYRT